MTVLVVIIGPTDKAWGINKMIKETSDVNDAEFRAQFSFHTYASGYTERSHKMTKVINKEKNFSYNNSKDGSGIIGRGRYGTVYRGHFSDQKIAVKRILLTDVNNELGYSREKSNMRQFNHENVVKLIYDEDDDDFRYLALELCCADNLRDYCDEKYTGPMPTELQVLLQLTKGLQYIHSKDVIHRDIKPENILISITNPVVMKWADFGYSKPTNNRGSASMSGARGTKAWVAKEIIPFLRLRNCEGLVGRCSKQGDIFSAGCVFFFFLTRGVHPFGIEGNENELAILHDNIEKGNVANQSRLDDGHFGKNVVIQMIRDRIELSKVIEELENPRAHSTKALSIATTNSVLAGIIYQENIIKIVDLLQGKRKKSGWAVKARVIEGPSISYIPSFKPGVAAMKQLLVKLDDGSGQIQARACTAKICNKFYPKIFQEKKEYLIKNAKVSRFENETILSLNGKTEVKMI